MAVELRKRSGDGSWHGGSGAVVGYNVTEDATPKALSDSSGGAGVIKVDLIENPETLFLMGAVVALSDDVNGDTIGVVDGISGTNGEISIAAYSRLAKLTVDRAAGPYHGSLSDAFRYYFSLVGLIGDVIVDESLDSRQVAYPAFDSNLWTFLKEVCAAEEVELALVDNNVVVRGLRGRNATMHYNSEVSFDIAASQVAEQVEVFYYNNEWVEKGHVYPAAADYAPRVLQVAPGQVIQEELQADTSLVSVFQPQPYIDGRNGMPPSTESWYFVLADNETPIDPAHWNEHGGYVKVEIHPEDNTKIIVTVRGADGDAGNYKIAYGTDQEQVSALHILGTGVRTERRSVVIPTGANPAFVTEDQAPTVDSVAVRSRSQAFDVARRVAALYAGPNISLSVNARKTAQYTNPNNELSFDAFNNLADAEADYTFDTYNQQLAYEGIETFDDFNAAMRQYVNRQFSNQAFGNIAGTRVRYRDLYFRIRSATIDPGGINYSAERDTLFDDFNEVWAGATFDDFNTYWSGKSFEEFNLAALSRQED